MIRVLIALLVLSGVASADCVDESEKQRLIAMKREAGRPKDLRDIAALTEVERNP